MQRISRWVFGGLLTGLMLTGTACNTFVPMDASLPVALKVEVLEGDLGSEEDPIPSSQDGFWPTRTFKLKGTVLTHGGELSTGFTRRMHIRVEPGEIVSPADGWIDMEGGEVTFTVQVRKVFGESRIWLEDIGTDDAPGSYLTGVSDPLVVERPTISDIQYVPDGETCKSPNDQTLDAYECNALPDRFVELRADSRLLVVTSVTTDGFFVTDCTAGMGSADPCAAANGNYQSLFAFNFSAPRGLLAGDVLATLSGNVAEFYGATQLGFPDWTVDLLQPSVPVQPAVLDTGLYCGDLNGMGVEPYESDLIEVRGLTINDFANDSYDLGGYQEFGQWPATFSGYKKDGYDCEIAIASRETAPNFDPLANPGLKLDYVRGVLSTHASEYSDNLQWILLVRSADDIGCEGGCP